MALAGRLLLLGALAALVWCEDEDAEDGFDESDDGIEQDALTAEQMRMMHGKFDVDKSGKVSLHEILQYASNMRLEIARKDIHTILDEMDTSRDQKLSLEELLKDLDAQAEGADEEEMKNMVTKKELETAKFKLSDKDGDGLLDAEELPALFYPETNEAVLELTTEASLRQKDTNGDGKLTPKEFWEGDDAEEEAGLSNEEQEDFAKLDQNNDGTLDLKELTAWESGHFHTQEALKKMLEVADADGDMHITADELDAAREQIAGSDAQYHLLEWAEHNDL